MDRRVAEEKESGQKKRGRKPDEQAEVKEPKINLTDEDSRIMKTRQGYIQGYNAQAAVDCETQVIVGQAVTQDCNDKKQLEPMMAIIEAQSGETAEIILADAGYCSEANLSLETEETELFIAVNKEWKTKQAQREEGSPRGRIPQGLTSTQLMERKLLTQRGRKYYRLRGKTVEPVFGQIKTCRGITTLRLRGKAGADLEWSLCCTTHNLLKLWRWGMKNASKN
ncbi:transposase [Candidatus Woesearchaeota archaeon]|nr:transposase [Candidatus Woesearchaeota archaeon]